MIELNPLIYLIPIAGAFGLLCVAILTRWVFKKDTGTEEMRFVSDAIKEGAMAYLARQYKTIAIISVILGLVIMAAINVLTGVAFLIGAACSALSGYIGMYVSVNSNIRTASAARRNLNEALQVSFRGGAVSGIAVVTLSLLGVAGVFFLFWWIESPTLILGVDKGISEALLLAVGYAFGASFAALFAQLGGGIYTKAADVGADLVGKVEAGIPEDSPKNPAVIADLVGDNVGDCAGRGADLFESTAAENIGAMILGAFLYAATGEVGFVFFPLVARALGIFAGVVGIFLVKLRSEDEEPMKALNRGYYVSCVLAMVLFAYAAMELLGENWIYFVGCGIIGIVLSIAIVFITQYYTAGSYRPVREIAAASETGPATNIISGFAIGLETTFLPIMCIAAALLGAYELGQLAAPAGSAAGVVFQYGLYGTAVATMGMLAPCAFVLAEDTFGPITDNAGGIVEMSEQPKEIRDRTDKLDSVGNTTKALTKGYAMGSAALAAYLLFGAFFDQVAEKMGWADPTQAYVVDIAQPEVFVGALIGAMLVFLFASLAIRAVGKAAQDMIAEVRRQFKENPNILGGNDKPDYAKCVDISTKGALKAMILPGILPVAVPVLFGVFMHYAYGGIIAYQAVGAMLMVGTIAGVLMALTLNNGGGAWDNAKKFVESKGMKKTPVHAAAVVGDTVGDPFKDTAGPSLHVLVKLLSTITLVFAGVIVLGF
ncbi:MAG: K(+)-stimulated pyrophosphate-energized sodium pump [Methanomassiliicoccales archaeon PtaU1.Bin124]|nr:MAG: K(+)-stimulated pyrophosphate-energized sodium pump [Methanomassiliicoccales archaeon PtaU1.Bin124]